MKISLKKINKCDVLLIDNNYSNLDFKKFNYNNFDFDTFFFRYSIKTIINFFFKNKKKLNLKTIYKITIINYFNPKIIIDHSLTGRTAFLKKIFPEIVFIVYSPVLLQEGFKGRLKKNIIDAYKASNFFLILSSYENLFLKKNIVSYDKKKVFVTGSIRNNEYKFNNLKKKYDIVYISQFLFRNSFKKELIIQHNLIESKIIKLIQKFCDMNNKKYTVIMRSLRKEKYKKENFLEELNFIRSINQNFTPEITDSLNLSCQAKLIIANCSNLGIELFSAGKKVFFLYLINKSKFPLAYNLKKSYYGIIKKCLFFSKFEEKKIFLKLKNILTKRIKDIKFKEINKLVPYDKKNKLLKQIIQSVLKKENA